MSSPMSKSPEQTDKIKKYDRQIRLWGEHGQHLLELANICVINANGLGCEILKSLVLPGIGAFTIVDGSKVLEDDLGINFFVDVDTVGESKATACMRLLQELNQGVRGDSVEESLEYILENRPTFFSNFDVVLASNLNEKSLVQLSEILWRDSVPFIYGRSLGMIGSIRLQINEHCVIEAHPDNRKYDLRLEQPFPALQKYFEEVTVTSKVPWLIVLNKYLEVWRTKNGSVIPLNYKEKSELREMIREGISSNEENYEEAIKAVNTAFGGATIPQSLKNAFDNHACENLTKQSKPFWIMLKALKDFIQKDNNGLLPLQGILPDMTANTEYYVNLQNIYRQQAFQDSDQVYRRCHSLLKELGLPSDTITEKDVRLFCREAYGITIIKGTPIAEEYHKSFNTLNLKLDEMEIHGTLTEYYIGLRAYERYLSVCGNIPGEYYVENDTAQFKSIANKMLLEMGMPHCTLSDDVVHEICHYGGAEIHTISAFLGGCMAQEVVKILTKQYKPLDNTFLYNGITAETITMKL